MKEGLEYERRLRKWKVRKWKKVKKMKEGYENEKRLWKWKWKKMISFIVLIKM